MLLIVFILQLGWINATQKLFTNDACSRKFCMLYQLLPSWEDWLCLRYQIHTSGLTLVAQWSEQPCSVHEVHGSIPGMMKFFGTILYLYIHMINRAVISNKLYVCCMF